MRIASKITIPPPKLVLGLRIASIVAVVTGLLGGIRPAVSTYSQSQMAASLAGQATGGMSEIIDVIESISPGITGDMGGASESAASSMLGLQKTSKWLAVVEFIVPLLLGVLGFMALQGMATIVEKLDRLEAGGMPPFISSSSGRSASVQGPTPPPVTEATSIPIPPSPPDGAQRIGDAERRRPPQPPQRLDS